MLPYYFLQCQFYTAAMDQLAELSSSMREIAIWTPVATELSASGVNVTGLRWWPEHRCPDVLRADIKNGCPDHSSRCERILNAQLSREPIVKICSPSLVMWRLYFSEKFSLETETTGKTNKPVLHRVVFNIWCSRKKFRNHAESAEEYSPLLFSVSAKLLHVFRSLMSGVLSGSLFKPAKNKIHKLWKKFQS